MHYASEVITRSCHWCGVRVGVSVGRSTGEWERRSKLNWAMHEHEKVCEPNEVGRHLRTDTEGKKDTG